MTRQDIFDSAVRHLSEQNRSAREADSMRWDRMRIENTHGAPYTSIAGHFVGDSFVPGMNDWPILDVMHLWPEQMPAWFHDDPEFIDELEELHGRLPGHVDRPWSETERREVLAALHAFAECFDLRDNTVYAEFWLPKHLRRTS